MLRWRIETDTQAPKKSQPAACASENREEQATRVFPYCAAPRPAQTSGLP